MTDLGLLRENRDGKAVGALAICIPDALHLLQKTNRPLKEHP